MARRAELVAAGLAASISLLWLVYAVHTVQSLASAAGLTGRPYFHFNTGLAALLLITTAVLIFGLAGGAYLHVVHRRRAGIRFLCVCTMLLIVDLAAFEFAGWGFLPFPPEVESATLGWGVYVAPTVLPFLEVLVTSLGVVAVLASLSPESGEETEPRRRLFPSHL